MPTQNKYALPNWKHPKCSTGEQIKEIVVYLYKGILLSNENEWTTGTCDNVGESQKRCTDQKKPDAKDRVLYDAIHMVF